MTRTTDSVVRTYVIDTSVLLSDPKAMFHFEEHHVVIPLTVITELEHKRKDPDLGFFARQALRLLDELIASHGGLADAVPVSDAGGTLRIELNNIASEVLPLGMRSGDNDTRILAVAKHLLDQGQDVALVTKDLPMRIKASAIGIHAEVYRNELIASSEWSGVESLELDESKMARLYDTERLTDLPEAKDSPVNTGYVITSPRGSALARKVSADTVKLVRGDQQAFGLHGRSAEQRIALDLLMDPNVGIVSMGGSAGTGKSALALCAGMEAVLERREHRKITVFRPLYAVGGQELGYLPGSEGEKMGPWAQAVFDTLGSIVSKNVIDEVLERGMLEVLPLTHIRGRSLHDSFVIVDEAQSLERNVLLTVLSRIGQNSKVVLTHDVAQRDNLHVGRHDGVAAVVEQLKGHALFGHVTLMRSERSAIAALVTEMLEGPLV
ncbi:ribonuclease [Arthrobacter sp. MYb211]|uniref:PhoH family protein n=1 Tax=Micrococcaceae TaxID=1268 RepID=UPI000CFC23BC|nr:MULTISPECIES: PhoH family protein [unclassified Arthrobacter]PQZ98565.1 ribonuclease [Arthrobacter sp. MYb229]PRA09981.1 ribonuclease [Arthrobacter sp. MYb221]PRB47193.1 ribonuclease [Arthrobacter sp. MYb216]PRC05061.1 ribonuclease [Arthrobacter sp. MYb211]